MCRFYDKEPKYSNRNTDECVFCSDWSHKLRFKKLNRKSVEVGRQRSTEMFSTVTTNPIGKQKEIEYANFSLQFGNENQA